MFCIAVKLASGGFLCHSMENSFALRELFALVFIVLLIVSFLALFPQLIHEVCRNRLIDFKSQIILYITLIIRLASVVSG